ncbi:MAG: hypothetical protein LBK61_11270 [Spirochaetaceae bacterium]|jgi:hypothetical protein|nr:hypothetical protein [Spirochaetaceae bacterium]
MQCKKRLIVEGYFDKLFQDALLRSLGMSDIEVTIPQTSGSPYGGKGNAINLFASATHLLYDGSLEKLALIVDADFENISSQGFGKTLENIEEKVNAKGFEKQTKPVNYKTGIYFTKESPKVKIAAWIMPNNSINGYLEYLLFEALKMTKSSITNETENIVSKIQNKEYPPHHEMKAKLAVAMAMMENPGRNISHLMEKDMLDCNNNIKLRDFIEFLSEYFEK